MPKRKKAKGSTNFKKTKQSISDQSLGSSLEIKVTDISRP